MAHTAGADTAKAAAGKKEEASQYKGVSWHRGVWIARLWLPQEKHRKFLGSYATEEEAAKAYDHASTTLLGPDAYRNFPTEDIPEPPSSLGDKKKKKRTSKYRGVSKASEGERWRVRIYGGLDGYQDIGVYATQEDAARAYDYEALKRLGSSAELNFPAENIREPPSPLPFGGEKQAKKTSKYRGVAKASKYGNWKARISGRYIGSYATEEEAARAYDRETINYFGPDTKLNFPATDING